MPMPWAPSPGLAVLQQKGRNTVTVVAPTDYSHNLGWLATFDFGGENHPYGVDQIPFLFASIFRAGSIFVEAGADGPHRLPVR